MKSDSVANAPRLKSIDALRGFDMFFITGGAGIISGLCLGLGAGDCWLARQMSHVPWAGLAQHDTIFPLFLFLAGVSWPFSLAAQRARGRTCWQIHGKIVLRALILFVLGMTMGGLLRFGPAFRVPSVLGQIGLSWGIAAILSLHVSRPASRGLLIGGIMIGYWLLLALTGAPDAPVGADFYSKEWNVISWLDRTLMPNHIYVKGVYDPESLFSVPSGVSLALLGMSAGSVLRSKRLTPSRKAAALAGLSALMLALGLVTIFILGVPVVKALWTVSFVLVTASYGFALLALFFWIVDVKGWDRWTFYFRVIGMNSITIYLLMAMGVMSAICAYCFRGCVRLAGETWGPFVDALGLQLACWLVLLFFYRKKIFLKV